jgi:hypothetical protein
MSAPTFNILTQKELTIDLSRPAMEFVLEALNFRMVQYPPPPFHVVEVDNFRNTLHNLLERSEPKTENFDLIGE